MSPMRTRRFQPGDEPRVRDLLTQIKRAYRAFKPKSLELMHWKWHLAPGGPMDSWVIESQQADRDWKIVGHHSLCPIRFTDGDQDLLCAKTVNSMLLPEFRSKFLYLRFEQECLREAENRFDATYSCAARVARLRKPLGYVAKTNWIQMVRGLQSPEKVSRLLGHLACRYPHYPWGRIKRSILAVSSVAKKKVPIQLTEYSSIEAPCSRFFADFWDSARTHAGISPRRDIADLSWVLWQRPHCQYSTLTYTWEGGARAYCAINVTDSHNFSLDDIFVAPARVDLLEEFLTSVFAWCAKQGALLLRFSTTRDGQPEGFLDVFARRMYLPPLRRYRPEIEFPRRLSREGRIKIDSGWNVTNIVRPG
jgi:hypothetical protein